MCAYFSKADNETSEVIKQAAKEASASRKFNRKGIFYQKGILSSREGISGNARI